MHGELPDHLSLAREVVEAFPGAAVESTSDLVQVDVGPRDEGTILLLFLPDAVEVRFRVVQWPGPHTPILGSRLWKRRKYECLDRRRLLKLVREAEQAWKNRLAPCFHCLVRFPPERMVDRDGRVCCHGCAEQREGIVF